MTSKSRFAWVRPLCRAACIVAAVSTLAGCVVAPYPGYYGRPHYWYRY